MQLGSSNAHRPGVTSSQQQLVIQRVLKHLRLAKAKRTLQTRLRLAGFKAARGWQDITFDEIEPYLAQSSQQLRPEFGPRRVLSQPPLSNLRHPSRLSQRSQSHPHPYRPSRFVDEPVQTSPSVCDSVESEPTTTTKSMELTPASDKSEHTTVRTPSVNHHSHSGNLYHFRTPEQMVRSKWACKQSINGAAPGETDDDVADQTTAAELMLFLASGSPSPEHRLSLTPHHHRSNVIQSSPSSALHPLRNH